MENHPPPDWTDEQLIRSIRAGGLAGNRAWHYIYNAWRPYYLGPIKDAGGTAEEVREVLSKVMIDLQKQICKEDFQLERAILRTYFVGNVINAWKESRRIAAEKQRRQVEYDPQTHAPGGHEPGVEEMYIREERAQRVRAALEQLGARCQNMLTLYGNSFSMEEIAGEMGFAAGADTAKKEVAKCRTRLRKLLEGKPI